MHYVYLLQSVAVPGHFYIGSTDNLLQRLRQHQADVDAQAAKYRPWKLKTYLAFEQKAIALRSRVISNPARVGHFVSVTSTSRIRHHCWIATDHPLVGAVDLFSLVWKQNRFCLIERHMRSQLLTEISRSGRRPVATSRRNAI